MTRKKIEIEKVVKVVSMMMVPSEGNGHPTSARVRIETIGGRQASFEAHIKNMSDVVFTSNNIRRRSEYDLVTNVLQVLGAKIKKVILMSINGVHALVLIEDKEGNEFRIKSELGDAISLCMKMHAAIFISDELLERYGSESEPKEGPNGEMEITIPLMINKDENDTSKMKGEPNG